ncbi:MAG TPA: tetratricopeptide repeat protein [Acidobacteriaceae bacterium]
MRGFLLGAGLLGAMFFIGGAKLLVSQQQTSSPTKSDQAKSAAKGGAKTDPANAVPDAPQPQKEPATNAPDSSGAHSDATGPSESESEKKTSSNKDVPPQRTPDAPNKPSTSDRPTEANNPFPEDVSRRAAQQDTQETPAAPASSGEEPASPPEHTAAGDNPFPEDISRKAAKASGDPASGSGGASQENPPNVPLPPGVSSSQSSALPDPSQTRHALGIVDATRAKKDNQVGDFYLAGGNFKGAYERYKDATTHDPTNVDAIFGLAEASKGLKQFAEAQHNYLLYLDILPNGPKAKQALKALTAIEGKQ